MKKTNGILNAELSRVIAETGHKDLLTVTDAGLPIPQNIERIDLSLIPNIPRFIEVLKAVLDELCVEEIIMAEEIKEISPEALNEILSLFSNDIVVTFVSHDKLKKMSSTSRAAIRSGEFTSFSNIILKAGVAY